MSIDRSEQGTPVLKDSLDFAKGFLERDLSRKEISGLTDLTGVYGATEVNDRMRDIVGGIREEKNVAEYLDTLFKEKGLSLVDVVALDFAYGDDADIHWVGQLDNLDDPRTWSGA